MNATAATRTALRDRVRADSFAPLDSHRLRDFVARQDFVRDHFPWLEHGDHGTGPFEANVNTYCLSGSVLSIIHIGEIELVRTRCLAETSEAGYAKLILQMSGSLQIEQDDRSCRIGPGQVGVCDTTRPYRIRVSDRASFAVLMLPHEALPGWKSISKRICGTKLTDGITTHAAFGALMTLTNLPSGLVATEGAPVLRAVQWMLSTSLLRAADDSSKNMPHDAQINKARLHVLQHIADPSLDADNIAAALCMSRRSLYMLFKGYQITPSKMIRDIRMDQAMQCLGDPRESHRKITDIAFDFGYTDGATFSRLFKTRFGVAPSEFRLQKAVPLCV